MRILFIGCGHMGSAIVDGMLKSGKFNKEQIAAILPEGSPDIERIKSSYGIEVFTSYPQDEQFDAVLFAIKPQTLDEVAKDYSIPETALLISIAAGKTISFFENHFSGYQIVRTMPNMNAMVGKGSTVGIANTNISEEQSELVENIFNSVGSFEWTDNEELMDPVTAISGSGPAYFFLFVEYLAEAAEELGLSPELSQKLAIETFIGAGYTLEKSGISPSELRESVTSPGGTTFAALEAFRENGALEKIIKKSVKAASARGKELAKNS